MSTSEPPAPKRAKTDDSGAKPPAFKAVIEAHRMKAAPSVMDFKFNKARVRMLSKTDSVGEKARGIVYWMSRDQRVQDNWAMLLSQKLAIKSKIPLHVVFCLMPKFLDATWRHYDFMLKGLKQVEKECMELNISFHLVMGQAATEIPAFVEKHSMGAVVCDFSPLRGARQTVDAIKAALPEMVAHCQVDAHNVVPCWVASNKLEYAARTIRNKINSKLDEYLTAFPPVIKHPFTSTEKPKGVDWSKAEASVKVDMTVGPVSWATPGEEGGLAMLESFCKKRINSFESQRNDPNADALSNLSPWLHFGQISAARVALVVKEGRAKFNSKSVASFLEELIIRRELSDNFCLHNDKYDSIEGANDWAKKSLDLHRKDKRDYLYTTEQWDKGRTHDRLWNAAQLQLVNKGKMHGFMRMYWAKKILEWSESPESALATAIYLNDRYSLDGRDPSGYVGCMWSICGIHDQGWAERKVFGKIRYMNFQGCKRKFDVERFSANKFKTSVFEKNESKETPAEKKAVEEKDPEKKVAKKTAKKN